MMTTISSCSPKADRLESSQKPAPSLPMWACSHSISRISQSKKKLLPITSVMSVAPFLPNIIDSLILHRPGPLCNPHPFGLR